MKALKPLFFLLILFLASCSHPRYEPHAPRVTRDKDRTIAVADAPVKKINRGLIVIDPGHGGEDDGTKSLIKPIFLEKYLNLTTAKYLAAYLEQMGYQTIMTRYDDTFIPLKARAQFANERRPLLFVSVHYNAATSAQAQGVEVFYYKSEDNKSRTHTSKSLASSILGEVLLLTGAPSRGVKHGNYAVIRETDMPAVLIEGGFLTNTEEYLKLKQVDYLKKVAWGIAVGINKFVLGAS